MSLSTSPDAANQRIQRLEDALVVERARADSAERQLREVQEAVRAFEQRQEVVIRARKAREATMLEQARLEGQRGALRPAGHHGSEQLVDVRTIIDAGVAAAWGDPDPTLDDRLDRYLESSFEPDRSRDWMLEG